MSRSMLNEFLNFRKNMLFSLNIIYSEHKLLANHLKQSDSIEHSQ